MPKKKKNRGGGKQEEDENTRIAIVNADKVRGSSPSALCDKSSGTSQNQRPVPATLRAHVFFHALRPLSGLTVAPLWVLCTQCKPKKCKQECKRSCPVVRLGPFPNVLPPLSPRCSHQWLVLYVQASYVSKYNLPPSSRTSRNR